MTRLGRRLVAALAVLATVCAGTLALLASATPAASAFSPVGYQRLLIVPIEHGHASCPTPVEPTNVPKCPRHTAADWQLIFQDQLDSWFKTESYGRTRFVVRVLKNPDTANGWWPAPRSREEYGQHDAFTQVGSIGRDAGEIVVGQALQRGVLGDGELALYDRFIMMDNYHARGGTTYGGAITYHPDGLTFTTTASLIPEAPNDAETLSLARHELGHQLGLPDLYEQPCKLVPPGDIQRDHRNRRETNCYGPWDHMGIDDWGFPGLGAWSRQRLGWLNPDPSSPSIREIDRTFSGTITVDPVNRPAGNPLVIRIPNSPTAAAILGIFGHDGPYRGFLIECRRKILNDSQLVGEGALVTYYEPSRNGWSPLAVARNFPKDLSKGILSTPGARYSNNVLGVMVTYVGPSASGGCVIDINKTRKLYPDYTPIGDLAAVAAAAPAYGGPTSFAGFAGSGILVSGGLKAPAPTSRVGRDAKRGKVQPVVKGKPATIRFAYGNAGTKKAKGGTAVVRVDDPYAVTVCGRPAKGRVVAKVPLRTLKPGKSATGKVTFTPRSNGPIGVSVEIRGKGTDKLRGGPGKAAAAMSFTTAETGKSRTSGRTSFRIRAAKKGCAGPVSTAVTPLVQPPGWTFTVKGAAEPLAPGKTRKVTITATTSKSAKPSALQIPVSIAVGSANSPADGTVRYGYTSGELDLVGGLDVMLRSGRPGKLPAFQVAGPPAGPIPIPYPTTQAAPSKSTLVLTCPSSADFSVTVPGALTPVAGGAVITLTYRRFEDNVTITHTAVTGPDGKFTDSFSDPRPGWQVRAAFAGDGAQGPATSNACEFGQIITRIAG